MKFPFIARLVVIITLCFLTTMSFCQEMLPVSVLKALDDSGQKREQLVAKVVALDEGPLSLSWQADKSVSPASTEKMITTLAALEMLGPAYRWKTSYAYRGKIVSGTLKGTLYVKGNGDPKYVVENLWRDLARLKSLGIYRIEGNVAIDRSRFMHERQDPEFKEDWDRPYTATADAALLNFQSVSLTLKPDYKRLVAEVFAQPTMSDLRVPESIPLINGQACVRWRQALQADVKNGLRPIIRGGLPGTCEEKNFSYLFADSNLYWESVFRSTAAQLSILWSGKVIEAKVPEDAVLLFDAWSEELAQLVRQTNKFSNNVFAKHMMLTLAAEAQPEKPAGYTLARQVIDSWLINRVGIKAGDVFIDNGSGLSRKSRVSAQAMTALIEYGWKSPRMPDWVSSFPIAGVDGTMKKRHAAAGSAYVKTGLLNGVKSAGGIVQAASGKRYGFFCAIEGARATESDRPIDSLIEWIFING